MSRRPGPYPNQAVVSIDDLATFLAALAAVDDEKAAQHSAELDASAASPDDFGREDPLGELRTDLAQAAALLNESGPRAAPAADGRRSAQLAALGATFPSPFASLAALRGEACEAVHRLTRKRADQLGRVLHDAQSRLSSTGSSRPLPSVPAAAPPLARRQSSNLMAGPTSASGRLLRPSSTGIDWHAAFQDLLEASTITPEQVQERASRIEALSYNFGRAAAKTTAVIVAEHGAGVGDRLVPPLDVGGIAGGEKFMHDHQFFKFAVDCRPGGGGPLYGHPTWAAKAMGHELKALNSMVATGVRGVRFVLMAVVDIFGRRLCAQSLLSLQEGSLVYGSQDAGASVLGLEDLPHALARAALVDLAGALNLGPRSAVPFASPHRVATLHLPVDAEGHVVDGALYLLDCARLFPPEPPAPSAVLDCVYLPQHVGAAEVPFRLKCAPDCLQVALNTIAACLDCSDAGSRAPASVLSPIFDAHAVVVHRRGDAAAGEGGGTARSESGPACGDQSGPELDDVVAEAAAASAAHLAGDGGAAHPGINIRASILTKSLVRGPAVLVHARYAVSGSGRPFRCEFLYRLLRPELVAASREPVSPDTYSSFFADPVHAAQRFAHACRGRLHHLQRAGSTGAASAEEQARLEEAAARAERFAASFRDPHPSHRQYIDRLAGLDAVLRERAVHAAAEEVVSRCRSGPGPALLRTPVKDILHDNGVNLRFLGAVRARVPETAHQARALLLAEMLARAFRRRLYELWRDRAGVDVARVRAVAERECSDFLRPPGVAASAGAARSAALYCVELKERVSAMFPGALSAAEHAHSRDLRFSLLALTADAPVPAAGAPGSGDGAGPCGSWLPCYRSLLAQRLRKLTGVEMESCLCRVAAIRPVSKRLRVRKGEVMSADGGAGFANAVKRYMLEMRLATQVNGGSRSLPVARIQGVLGTILMQHARHRSVGLRLMRRAARTHSKLRGRDSLYTLRARLAYLHELARDWEHQVRALRALRRLSGDVRAAIRDVHRRAALPPPPLPEPKLREAVVAAEGTGEGAALVQLHLILAQTWTEQARMLRHRLFLSEAVRLLKAALAYQRAALGTLDSPVCASTVNALGVAYSQMRAFPLARLHLETALRIRSSVLGSHSDTAATLVNLGNLFADEAFEGRDLARAKELFEGALAIQRRRLTPGHRFVLASIFNLALLCDQIPDEKGAARAYYAEAASGFERIRGGDDPLVDLCRLRASDGGRSCGASLAELLTLQFLPGEEGGLASSADSLLLEAQDAAVPAGASAIARTADKFDRSVGRASRLARKQAHRAARRQARRVHAAVAGMRTRLLDHVPAHSTPTAKAEDPLLGGPAATEASSSGEEGSSSSPSSTSEWSDVSSDDARDPASGGSSQSEGEGEGEGEGEEADRGTGGEVRRRGARGHHESCDAQAGQGATYGAAGASGSDLEDEIDGILTGYEEDGGTPRPSGPPRVPAAGSGREAFFDVATPAGDAYAPYAASAASGERGGLAAGGVTAQPAYASYSVCSDYETYAACGVEAPARGGVPASPGNGPPVGWRKLRARYHRARSAEGSQGTGWGGSGPHAKSGAAGRISKFLEDMLSESSTSSSEEEGGGARREGGDGGQPAGVIAGIADTASSRESGAAAAHDEGTCTIA